jgi:fatty-acyl-CoA synthase
VTETSTPSVYGAAATNPWLGKVVRDALDTATDRWPDRVAIVNGETQLTFAELAACRDRLASALARRGVGEGTHVGLLLRRSWEQVVLLHALWRLGAVAVTLNTSWEAFELEYALGFTDVEILIASTNVAGASLTGRLTSVDLPVQGPISSSRLPRLRSVVTDDPSASTDADWRLQDWLDEPAGELPPVSHAQDTVMIFTSGSSSRPKAVVVRQESLLGSAHFFMGQLGLTSSDRFLGLGQHFHAGGLVQLLGTMLYGAEHYLFDGFQLDAMVRTIHERKINATTGFDLVLIRILDELDRIGWPSPLVAVGAAPGTAVHDRLEDSGARVVMMYAMSEAANMVTLTAPALESERGRMSSGYAMPGVSIRICDAVTGEVLPVGTPGEICFHGWNLFSRYYNDPEKPAEAIDEDGFFHTGDYGFIDDEGRLYYRGRYSMMIKTGGENVSETEVESFLMREVPGVVAAAVVGAPDERWGEAVVAFVELEPGMALDPEALRDACRGKIAGYKIPKRFYDVKNNGWPTSPMGKLMKQELRATASQPSTGPSEATTPL